MPRHRSTGAILTVPILVLGLLLVMVPVGATPAPAGATTWKRCGGGFRCSTLDVPVDYATPDGPSVSLALIRLPASDPRDRLGSLVINFGGPGDPGTATLRDAAASIPTEIRDRFDLVSFDPRGTGASRPIDCVDDATFERAWNEDPTPNGPHDLPRFYAGTNSSVDMVKGCIDRQGAWLAHVGTRNVAQDLDRIRIALGEPRLNYLGYSYGTAIGAVYAQMFPQRIRTMVLDSPVDLSVTNAQSQLANAAGFERALDAFLDQCATKASCAFHSDGDPRVALVRIKNHFEQGMTVPTDDRRGVGAAAFYTGMLAALYDRASWPTLAKALHQVDVDHDGSLLRLFADAYTGRRSDGTYDNLQEAIGVINCADRPETRAPYDVYVATYQTLSAQYPFFGSVLAGSPTGCDPRLPAPSATEALGDVRATGAPPILVIGTTQDPATPFAGATDLVNRLTRARLLTFDSTEHGSYAKGSACIDTAVDAYLVRRTLPASGRHCAR